MAMKPDRFRFDDVMWQTNSPRERGRELALIKKNIMWCKDTGVTLAPAILCEESDKFPEGITWLYEMTEQGIIYPDLHGWDHGPYHTSSQVEVEEHLDKAQAWFESNLGVTAIRWVTPHGSNSVAMQAAAAKYGLVIETTDYPVVDQKLLDGQLRWSRSTDALDGIVVMNHWWERGLRLYRIARIVEHQGIEEAIEATRSELSVKDHKICWGGEWMI